jgi:hypothetical protein
VAVDVAREVLLRPARRGRRGSGGTQLIPDVSELEAIGVPSGKVRCIYPLMV